MGRLSSITVDPHTRTSADPARVREWDSIVVEFLADEEALFGVEADLLECVHAPQATLLTLKLGEKEVAQCTLARNTLAHHVHEYVDVVRRLEQADSGEIGASVEALDMAKKLSHDDAARAVQEHCAVLAANHCAARRLWTLLLSLRLDTTRLLGVRGHRPVR